MIESPGTVGIHGEYKETDLGRGLWIFIGIMVIGVFLVLFLPYLI